MNSEPVLITCLAQRGNIGKSTCMAGMAGWLEQRGVPWQGFDLDPDHCSFSRLYPDAARLVELGDEPEGDVIKVLRHATDAAVTLIDPRAHLSATVLKAWDMIRFPESFAASGARIIALLFPSDDLDVMSDLDATVTRLGDRVRYVVVRNPARSPRTRMFDRSELEAELHRLGAAFLEIPVLLSLARNHPRPRKQSWVAGSRPPRRSPIPSWGSIRWCGCSSRIGCEHSSGGWMKSPRTCSRQSSR